MPKDTAETKTSQSIQHHGKAPLGIVEFIALMATMTSLVALSIDAMLPALIQIGDSLNATDPHQVHLIVTVFFLGMAIGQPFFGPLADSKGRQAAMLIGLGIFVLGTFVCMLATNMETMLVGRVIQAFGVSGPRIAAMAIIRDLYVGDAMARVMSFIMMVFILVPMIAPIVGQTVMVLFSWFHIFTLFLVVAGLSGLWFVTRQGETLPVEKRTAFSFSQLVRSCKFIFTHPIVMSYSLAMASLFGAFLAYLSASQTIYQSFYDMGEWFPLIFATLAFSIGLASYFNGKMVMKFGMLKLCNVAIKGVMVFATTFLVLLFVYDGLPSVWITISTLFVGFFFIGILFGNLNALAMQPLGDMAGLGAAIIGSMSSLFAVPIALFIDSFIEDNLYPIGIGFFVFFGITTALMLYGEKKHG